MKKISLQKTVDFYLKILLSKNFNRSDLIIGVGGGITGDIAGFVASIFKRGINFINVPTTLLAQVDHLSVEKQELIQTMEKILLVHFTNQN